MKDFQAKERIIPVYIEEEMRDAYLSYAMSVIVGRALPDVRDGLKPVHRRILYAMQELNLEYNKPYKKSARIVGEVLGKYHPHGDMAVYDSLVRMVQDFSLRYPLIDGQGNFGSIDGDAPAAMRYTEARLASISQLILNDIEKNTVNFMPNFDASLREPTVLPATLPNLLVNGSSGIAVGMATNIPPHNLNEIADGIIYLIDNPNAELKTLMRYIKGPDFPTGGIICGSQGIKDAYRTGKGRLVVRARATVERQKGGKDYIVITEIPYQVNKSSLIETIALLVQDKKIDGITDIRDESDKEGMRIVIVLRRDIEPQLVLNQLYKHTQLETTFGVIMLALVNNQPRILNLREMIHYYIEHRKDIIRRRTRFELDKAEKRAHILEGLKVALKHIDRIIKIIKTSKTVEGAKETLIKRFELSAEQSQAILEMQLQRLTALERDKIDAEYKELIKKIELYKSILASERKIEEIIKQETVELKRRFGDERRTEIIGEVEEIEIEDLIAEEEMVITLSHAGYIKRLGVSSYRKQHRGGRGVTAMETREEDFVEHLFIASTKDYLLIFTNKGRCYWLKVYEIPQASRTSKGKAIVNLLSISKEEVVTSVVAVKEFKDTLYLFLCTKQGLIKKIKLSAFSNPRKGGIVAVTLRQDDELVSASITDGRQHLLLATKDGKVIRFPEKQVRDTGRVAQGVRGIKLGKKDKVIGTEVFPEEIKKMGMTLLTVTTGGFVKRTDFDEYRIQSRGGKGIINIKTTRKNGEVAGIKAVREDDEIMAVTKNGMMVRCLVKDIRQTGRNAQGVRLISLHKDDYVSSVARVVSKEA
jgi:DNA gyrase subunit A